MAMKIDLIRPDDLLNLRIEAVNLRLDFDELERPALVVEDSRQPAYLIVTFPPQTIAESAFFQWTIVKPDADPERLKNDPDKNAANESANEPLDPPGQAKPPRRASAQLSHPSRLVFKVPPTTRIPFSTEGLLDWSKLELSVNPIAAIGPNPTQDQINKAPDIRQPAQNETAIELPYRLLISPNRDVAWNHRAHPLTTRGRTELWHTRLQLKTEQGPVELSREQRAPLRAIWSPDYTPNNPPPPTEKDRELNRTAMAPNDRHQIVILTSAFRGYVVDIELGLLQPNLVTRVNPSNVPNDLAVGVTLNEARFKLKYTVPYTPEPFEVEQLMLTPLGGWLRSRGHWNPPRKAPPVVIGPVLDLNRIFARGPLVQPSPLNPAGRLSPTDMLLLPPSFFQRASEPDSLDLSEWVHIATQGRDHYVRIVYEGELWPCRHRAALVKVTERKFMEANGVIGAYLMQRMFIVVREPEKRFAKTEYGMPFKTVRLTTLVTPDIAAYDDPQDPADPIPNMVAKTKRSFWVKVMTGSTPPRALFKFHAVGTDVSGDTVDFTMPMMFVSKMDIDLGNLGAVAKEYNDKKYILLRDANVPGQKVMFAERDAAKPNDNTRLVTQSLNFVVDAAGNPPQMLKAEVKIPQVADLLGTDAATTISFYKNYLTNGFDAQTGVFAKVVKVDFGNSAFDPDKPFTALVDNTLGVTFSSDKAGGFATPNLGVTTLTRSLGPLAGKAEDAVLNQFKPEEFFKRGMAKLFGSLDLVDLLEAATTHDQNAPKITTRTEDVAGGKLIIVTLDWEPKIKNLPIPPSSFALVRFQKKDSTKLLIHGRIEKPVKLDNLGAPAADGVKFEFNGKLNDFTVGVLESVFINFVEFSFEARAGQKLDVKVKLDPVQPMRFAGDLAFVEELRKAIPPDLFGKGPSLELLDNPPGVRAGFAFALPPIAVGVFSLKDVSLGAALTLPFLDGKPVFDFNVSERAHPFLLAVAIFGGGGFFHLQLDTAGIKMLEAAFEFGATAALDIGVASGEVHIMAGIYFALQRKEPGTDMVATLSGYLRMGGSLSVLGLIKISVEFNLSFTYDGAKDKAYGRATLTVQVEVLFFSMSVELTVERAFGGKSGDPKFGELMNTPEAWNEYALAFA
jgi:hypothetical protein